VNYFINIGGKALSKTCKIQRLVTPLTLQRKRHLKAQKIKNGAASREAASEYAQLLANRIKEKKEKRHVVRLSSTRKSASK
jgi:small subunit ribosomal protein S6e